MNTLDPALLQRINDLEKLGFSFAGNMFRGGVDVFYRRIQIHDSEHLGWVPNWDEAATAAQWYRAGYQSKL